jgi:hypothetical protein
MFEARDGAMVCVGGLAAAKTKSGLAGSLFSTGGFRASRRLIQAMY